MNETEHWNEYDSSGIGVGAYTDSKKLESLIKDKNILEVGCGRGLKLASLKNAKKRSGVDPSSVAIKYANELDKNVDFQVAFAENLPYEDCTFDLVYSLEVIEHVKEYQSMLNEIYRVLKPDGILFIQTPNYPVKRMYDLISWIRKKRPELADDYTHVTKLSSFKLIKVIKKSFNVNEAYARNIFLDSKLKFLDSHSIKKTIGLLFGQKSIVIASKKVSYY